MAAGWKSVNGWKLVNELITDSIIYRGAGMLPSDVLG